MTQIEVRVVSDEERPHVLYWLPSYSLEAGPPLPDREERLEILRQRTNTTCVAVFEDGEAVSTAASTALTQNVRGKLFPAGGVWGVATHPAARRKGYVRRVFTTLMESLRDQGEVFSTLYPFRESFYQRLGYVAFPMIRKARFSPVGLLPLLKLDLGGEVELMSIAEDGFDAYRDFMATLLPERHGMGLFTDGGKARVQKRNSVYVAQAKVDDEVEGIMLYSLKGEMPTAYTLDATRFYYRSSRGRYLLLSWIARHIDQAEQVEILVAATEQPEMWWPDLRVDLERYFFPPMGRIVDVAKLAGMEVGQGDLTLHISDPICPWNEGTWRFASDDGVLTVEALDYPADASLTIQGLSALMYGTHSPEDFAFRGWGDPSSEVSQVVQTLFPQRIVHLHEIF